MSKFTAIQQQLEQASGRKAAPAPPELPASPTTTTMHKAPSRAGKAHIGAYLNPDFKRSLRLIQAQTGEDVQSLIAKALNDLFRAYNVPVIDP
jgi:antitoxin-like ribbon-helix-helix protein